MSKLITVTIPEEQWEATIKAIEVVCQQADRIAELEEILDACQRQRDAWRNFAELFDKERKTTPQTKPLSDEEIWKIYGITGLGKGMALRFARAIEERHGIK